MSVTAEVSLKPASYPKVPSGLEVDADVASMKLRFERHQEGGEPLPSMAYFCLTVLEFGAGGRRKAAKYYNISKDILSDIAKLSSARGGTEARKVGGSEIENELTAAERRWLINAVKCLIHRAAEIAYDPNQEYPRITMTDVPDSDLRPSVHT
jgi:hypothetical protein